MKRIVAILVLLLATGAIGYTPPADKLPAVVGPPPADARSLMMVTGTTSAPAGATVEYVGSAPIYTLESEFEAPASVQAGDIIVIWSVNLGGNVLTGATSTHDTFTALDINDGTKDGRFLYLLAATDTGTVEYTGVGSEGSQGIIWQFRPSSGATVSYDTGNFAGAGTAGPINTAGYGIVIGGGANSCGWALTGGTIGGESADYEEMDGNLNFSSFSTIFTSAQSSISAASGYGGCDQITSIMSIRIQ
jgi:hypothetical protein